MSIYRRRAASFLSVTTASGKFSGWRGKEACVRRLCYFYWFSVECELDCYDCGTLAHFEDEPMNVNKKGLCFCCFREVVWEIFRLLKTYAEEWCHEHTWRMQCDIRWSQVQLHARWKLESCRSVSSSFIFNASPCCYKVIFFSKIRLQNKCLVFFSYVQFPSRSSYDSAMRAIAKKGRLYRLERVINPLDKTNRVRIYMHLT